jgi:hypothetical protein
MPFPPSSTFSARSPGLARTSRWAVMPLVLALSACSTVIRDDGRVLSRAQLTPVENWKDGTSLLVPAVARSTPAATCGQFEFVSNREDLGVEEQVRRIFPWFKAGSGGANEYKVKGVTVYTGKYDFTVFLDDLPKIRANYEELKALQKAKLQRRAGEDLLEAGAVEPHLLCCERRWRSARGHKGLHPWAGAPCVGQAPIHHPLSRLSAPIGGVLLAIFDSPRPRRLRHPRRCNAARVEGNRERGRHHASRRHREPSRPARAPCAGTLPLVRT